MLEQHRYEDNRNIYVRDYNLLFFKIPKVAITSIWQISANLLGHNLTQEGHLRQFRLPSLSSEEIRDSPNVYKVAYVRNPWERLLSCYLQKKNKHLTAFFQKNNLDPNINFEEFARSVCEIPDSESDRHFRSQYTYVFDHESNLLPDFIGAFSSFNSDMYKVLNNVGAPQIEIPHYNRIDHGHYTDYFSPELAKAVGHRYKLDIDIFGFEYGQPIGEEFYGKWQEPLSTSTENEILSYKANKLLRCLSHLKHNSILAPTTLRQRLRILIKGQ